MTQSTADRDRLEQTALRSRGGRLAGVAWTMPAAFALAAVACVALVVAQ